MNVNCVVHSGMRSCIGKRFAQIETISVLAMLVLNFDVSTPVKSREVLLQPTTGLTLLPKVTSNHYYITSLLYLAIF